MYKNIIKFVVGKTRLNINTCLIITAVALLASSCTPPKTVRYTKKNKHKAIEKQVNNNKELYTQSTKTAKNDNISKFEELLIESKKSNSAKNSPVETKY